MQVFNLEFGPMEVVCRAGDPSTDIYYLKSGKLLICTIQGTQVKAISRISPGEFVGELSFFDGKTRASHIVTLEKSTLVKIPKQELADLLPFWFMEAGKNLTKKIRLLDEIIQEKNFRKVAIDEQKPLTIEEQRKLLALITHQDT